MKRLVITLVACNSPLDQRLAIVREPRVLAVASEPAEVVPGASVMYSALVASPDGPVAAAPGWALCTAPKPPTEDNAVSDACLATGVDLGSGATVAATVPDDACILFGPDVPGGGFRPRDPDPTGGFYQPVRVEAQGADLAFGFTRIECKLGGAPAEVAHDYLTMYVANRNPTLLPTELAPAPAPDRDVVLTVSWPADAVESYLYYDPQRQVLVTRREAMHVAFFATGGRFPVDALAIGEDDPATSVQTMWHTPAAGPAWLWIVLRDSRGGFAVQQIAVDLR